MGKVLLPPTPDGLASSFSSLLFLLPSGLKIKCPVLALIMPFIFIFIRLRLCNLPMTSCDLRHLMCVGGGRAWSPSGGRKMLM